MSGLRQAYVALMRAFRRLFAWLGILPRWDRWAATSTFGNWTRSLMAVYDLQDLVPLDVPWWTYSSTREVEKFLRERPGCKVFEWGSGASTVWLAKRSAQVTSVEHDPVWAATVRALAPANARVNLVAPTTTDQNTQPNLSQKAGFHGLDFTAYVQTLRSSGLRPDLIVIDGRARAACLREALDHITHDGLIVFDNVNRARYRKSLCALGPDWHVRWTSGLTPSLPYSSQTALIQRCQRGRLEPLEE